MLARTARIEPGCVLLPKKVISLDEIKGELLAFSNRIHDDQAYALSQLINRKRERSSGFYDWI